MSEQTNGQHGASGTPSFVGGSFGVTGRELESDAEQDPKAAFAAVEDHEDTGPDILAGADSVPETVQEDVSRAQDTGTDAGTETAAAPSDVDCTSTDPSPGERNEPV